MNPQDGNCFSRAALVCAKPPPNGPPNVCVYEHVVGGNQIQQYFAYVEFVVAVHQMSLKFLFVCKRRPEDVAFESTK